MALLDLLPISLAYGLLKDGAGFLRSRRRRLSAAQVVQLRAKWKPIFEGNIRERQRKGLRSDVLVRDMKRIDAWPDKDPPKRGISPFFKVGLLDTYTRGILVGMRWTTLVKDDRSWRYPNRGAGEEGETLALCGYIPYENVEQVDWSGDEYGGEPHIYCYFDARSKEPYERVAFCEKKVNPPDITFYTAVADLEEVIRHSKKCRVPGPYY